MVCIGLQILAKTCIRFRVLNAVNGVKRLGCRILNCLKGLGFAASNDNQSLGFRICDRCNI